MRAARLTFKEALLFEKRSKNSYPLYPPSWTDIVWLCVVWSIQGTRLARPEHTQYPDVASGVVAASSE
jgi:hypothetical protein